MNIFMGHKKGGIKCQFIKMKKIILGMSWFATMIEKANANKSVNEDLPQNKKHRIGGSVSFNYKRRLM